MVFKMRDQRGGVLSKLFIIPAGVVVIIGVFLIGYYVGRGQSRQTAAGEKLPALPEVVSQYLPKKEDFTFYKTLTEKGEKNVSIELKPRPKTEEPSVTKLREEPPRSVEERPVKKETAEKPPARMPEQKAPQAAKPAPVQTAKKEPATAKASSSKIRYTIQVAAYPDRGMAEDEVRGMKRRGYAAFVVGTNLGDKGTWYRVRIGSFANRQSAEKLAGELKSKEGITTFITVE
jgi:DedD protein